MLAMLGGCGVPTGDPAQPIPASEVPDRLTAATVEPQLTEPPDALMMPAQVFLLASDDSLVARPREVAGSSLHRRVEDLLAELDAGPRAGERGARLSTALPPDVELALTGIDEGIATIDLSGSAQAPSGWASRQAVAQIVLTATSLAEVDAVLLTIDGDTVDAPLPSGELTAEPLRASDYAVYLTPGAAPS